MKNKFCLSSIVAFVICISQLYSQTTCPVPTGLTSSNITANSATVSWNATTLNAYYIVHYRPSNSTNWITVTVTTNSVNLYNLLCNTTYEWQVQNACPTSNGTTFSAFSASAYFTTLSCSNGCLVPTGLYANNITSTSATLHWNSTGATSYRIRYRPAGSSTWTNTSSSSTSKNLSGLTPATAYEWQVRSRCVTAAGTVTFSAWSPFSYFQTTGSNTCLTPTGLTSSYATSGILLSWNSTGASSYNIRYRLTNSATWTATTSSTNSKMLTGLAGGSAYEWQVQGVCTTIGSIVLSPWSASAFFTTNSPIAISPNPGNDRITVTHESASMERVNIMIKDFYGASLSSETRAAVEGINQYDINISNLKNGIYFLELLGKQGIQTVKFYVQH